MPAKIAQKIHFKILRQQKYNITICKYAIYERLLKFSVDSSASSSVYVYTLSGMTVLSNAPADEVHNLPAGLYIVRQGKSVKKIIVK